MVISKEEFHKKYVSFLKDGSIFISCKFDMELETYFMCCHCPYNSNGNTVNQCQTYIKENDVKLYRNLEQW